MTKLVNRRYRVDSTQTRIAIVLTAALMSFMAMSCTGFAEQVRTQEPQEEPDPQGLEAATVLYDSMVEVFREDTAGVDLEMEDQLLVMSRYEQVDEERRRRFVGRVVPAGGGIGVRISAEYQLETVDEDDQVIWEDQSRAAVEEEAVPDELRMARRVERLYNRGGPKDGAN